MAADPRYPAFRTDTDVVVFKFGFTLGSSSTLRTLSVDTPEAGIYREGGGQPSLGSLYGQVLSRWYTNSTSLASTPFYGSTTAEAAFVNVIPAPGVASMFGVLGFFASRRRR